MQAKPVATQAELDTFQAAYRDWCAATDEYNARINAIAAGTDKASAALDQLIDEMAAKHRHFIESSKPFVSWR